MKKKKGKERYAQTKNFEFMIDNSAGWKISGSCSELIYVLYAFVPQREHVIDMSFLQQWFVFAFTKDFGLNRYFDSPPRYVLCKHFDVII